MHVRTTRHTNEGVHTDGALTTACPDYRATPPATMVPEPHTRTIQQDNGASGLLFDGESNGNIPWTQF